MGTTQDAQQQKLYQKWTNFCSTLLINHDLQDSSIPRIDILQVYGQRFRHTHYSKHQVDRLGKESVSQAWRSIAAIHLLTGIPNPRNPPHSQAYVILDKCLNWKLKTYGIKDHPVKLEKAILLGIVHSIVAVAASTSYLKT